MSASIEHVVLVDEQNNVLGTADKYQVHGENTPLHRAFSVFIFDQQNRLLLQQRAECKKTWPGVWSNSCCGHPELNETNEDAVRRRCLYELGIELQNLEFASPYRYCFTHLGVMENEICPIFVARYQGELNENESEVKSTQWVAWADWLQLIDETPEQYSPWCVEESNLLRTSASFNHWLSSSMKP